MNTPGSHESSVVNTPWSHESPVMNTPGSHESSEVNTPGSHESSVVNTPGSHESSVVNTPGSHESSVVNTPWSFSHIFFFMIPYYSIHRGVDFECGQLHQYSTKFEIILRQVYWDQRCWMKNTRDKVL
jgi:hypothetical protein